MTALKKQQSFLFALLAAGTATPAFAQYTLNTLVTFTYTDWVYPNSNLILSDGILYGATGDGGTYGSGIIYSVPVGGGNTTTLASRNGIVNPQNPDTPAGLVLSAGTLYGTVPQWGGAATGSIFSVPVGGGNATTLATFNGFNGDIPCGTLVVAGGYLYGTTSSLYTAVEHDPVRGGDPGTVFSVPVGGGNVTTLAKFNGTNGREPSFGGMILAGNTLYGTTQSGGANGNGTVFSIPLSGGNITTLASFNGTDGSSPAGGLLADGGMLYGTTSSGGASGGGTVFSMPLTSGNITTIASFNGTNGGIPNPGLIVDALGDLYGSTSRGGANNGGTIFSASTATGNITTLVSFNGTNGAEPAAGLVFDDKGDMFGTTNMGGGNIGGLGTVFELSPTPVPEPATSSLLVFASAALLARRRGWRSGNIKKWTGAMQ